MFNRSGVRNSKAVAPTQILANVELQASVGCIIPADMASNGKVEAGTPLHIDLKNRTTAVKAAAAGEPMNAVLLHDVEVGSDPVNGTALIFGFVNVNRVSADVKGKIEAAAEFEGNSPLITFLYE